MAKRSGKKCRTGGCRTSEVLHCNCLLLFRSDSRYINKDIIVHYIYRPRRPVVFARAYSAGIYGINRCRSKCTYTVFSAPSHRPTRRLRRSLREIFTLALIPRVAGLPKPLLSRGNRIRVQRLHVCVCACV